MNDRQSLQKYWTHAIPTLLKPKRVLAVLNCETIGSFTKDSECERSDMVRIFELNNVPRMVCNFSMRRTEVRDGNPFLGVCKNSSTGMTLSHNCSTCFVVSLYVSDAVVNES